jgi:hypothetical protein
MIKRFDFVSTHNHTWKAVETQGGAWVRADDVADLENKVRTLERHLAQRGKELEQLRAKHYG